MTYIPADEIQTGTAKVLHEPKDGRNFAGQHGEPANKLTDSEKEKILTIWNQAAYANLGCHKGGYSGVSRPG